MSIGKVNFIYIFHFTGKGAKMLIKGFQKTTLLDYPSKVAATIFTGGCNFRCPFCHNASLVTHVDSENYFTEDEIFSYLNKRKGILDGICITGGEPLLQPDIGDFCEKVKALGLLIKLDTNGSSPEKLRGLINNGLIDYVAMDIKNSKSLYDTTCGTNVNLMNIERSVDLLMNGTIPYEFRTTVVRQFHTKESISELSEWIKGAKKYYLQSFKDSGDLICPTLSGLDEDEMKKLLLVAKKNIPQAELRGI